MKTVVVFRKWPNGDILALFPEEPHDRCGVFCMSYEHVGQHGGADYHGCVRRTSLALPRQYRDLAKELRQLGYDLDIRHRATNAMHSKRRQQAASGGGQVRYCKIESASVELANGAGDGAYGLLDVTGTPEEIGRQIAEELATGDMCQGPTCAILGDCDGELYLNVRIRFARHHLEDLDE